MPIHGSIQITKGKIGGIRKIAGGKNQNNPSRRKSANQSEKMRKGMKREKKKRNHQERGSKTSNSEGDIKKDGEERKTEAGLVRRKPKIKSGEDQSCKISENLRGNSRK